MGQMFAFVPLMAIPSLEVTQNVEVAEMPATKTEVSTKELRQEKADKINAYFKDRSMPLKGTGMTFVLVAEKYGLDWRLLPAIAVRESSGGKNACGYNPFGWGSCKLNNYSSFEQAIESVGKHLGGAIPSTAKYYAGKSSMEKLYYYNGTVIPTYPTEVLAIMKKIETYSD